MPEYIWKEYEKPVHSYSLNKMTIDKKYFYMRTSDNFVLATVEDDYDAPDSGIFLISYPRLTFIDKVFGLDSAKAFAEKMCTPPVRKED